MGAEEAVEMDGARVAAIDSLARESVRTASGSDAVEFRWALNGFDQEIADLTGQPYSGDRVFGLVAARTMRVGTGVLVLGNPEVVGAGDSYIHRTFLHEGFHARMLLRDDDCTELVKVPFGSNVSLDVFYPWLAGICLNEARVDKAVATALPDSPNVIEFPLPETVGLVEAFQPMAVCSAYGSHLGSAVLVARHPIFAPYAFKPWRKFIALLSLVPDATHHLGLDLQREVIQATQGFLREWSDELAGD